MIQSRALPPRTSQLRFRDLEDGSKENLRWHAFQISLVIDLRYDLKNLELRHVFIQMIANLVFLFVPESSAPR